MSSAFSGKPLNWTSKSKSIRRRYLRPEQLKLALDDAKRVATGLKSGSSETLALHGAQLKQFARRRSSLSDRETMRLVSLTCGGIAEAIRRCLAIDLYDVQMHAGVAVALGAVAEMQTGEGKTLALTIPICFHALTGKGVHVATPNEYLAKRDHETVAPILDSLGISADVVYESDTVERKRDAYDAEVTYGSGHTFGFDYLRDQLGIEEHENKELAERFYSRLRFASGRRDALQRPLANAIVDEIDHVLLDDAISPLVLSRPNDSRSAPDSEIHLAARDIAIQLKRDHHYLVARDSLITLTDPGYQSVYERREWAIHPELVRPWHEYVLLALRAIFQFQCDIDYVINNEQVHVVDKSTGRIFESRTWSDGLHQAIEAKENLSIRCETVPMASMTRQRFYRLYPFVAGVTGTAHGCERELASNYGLPVVQIPLRTPSNRRKFPVQVRRNEPEKLEAIVDETQALQGQGRAILIGTISISESHAVSAALSARGIAHRVLNGLQDASEADLVSMAGRCGAVTVATNMAGRGTDIQLAKEVAANGGLHVIVTQMQPLARVDRQLIGRCARCGDPGSSRVYLSADDLLPKQHAPWVGRAISRFTQGEDTGYLEAQLRRVQRQEEKRGAARRWRLLLADRDHEALVTRTPNHIRCDRLAG